MRTHVNKNYNVSMQNIRYLSMFMTTCRPCQAKRVFEHVRPTKIQISLRIRAICLES